MHSSWLTLDIVLESWVIVLLKEMYLNSLIQEKNTQIATTLLFSLDLYKKARKEAI